MKRTRRRYKKPKGQYLNGIFVGAESIEKPEEGKVLLNDEIVGNNVDGTNYYKPTEEDKKTETEDINKAKGDRDIQLKIKIQKVKI